MKLLKSNFSVFSPSIYLHFVLLFVLILVFNFISCGPGEMAAFQQKCTYDTITANATPINIDIANGSSGEVIMRVEVTSPNCINMGNSFKIELSNSTPSGITISGCSFQAMSQNAGNCQFTVHVPNGASPGNYEVELKTSVSLRGYDNDKEIYSTIHVNVTSSTDFSVFVNGPFNGLVEGLSFNPITVDINRAGGHNADIQLSIINLPDGMNYYFDPNPVPGNTNSTAMIFSLDYGVIPGTYSPSLVANDGATEKTYDFNISTIEQYTISAEPDSIAIEQGMSNDVIMDIDISHSEVYEEMLFTVEGEILGQDSTTVNASFNVNPLPWGTFSNKLTLAVGNSVIPGTYPITIKGATTNLEKSTTLQLTVLPAENN